MALILKQKKKCHIVAPDWLNVGEFGEMGSLFHWVMA
jgi:hypothetical protein